MPGTTDIGNHGDDTVTTIALPFSYSLYDQTFTSINLSSNGNAQFTTTDTTFTNQCLPWTTHNYTIYPYWDDLYLVNSGFGIFTSISGTAPNRIFNIEWRAQYFPGSGSAGFELRLYEGQTRFDVIYGTVTSGNTSATAGVQKNDTAFDQYFCNGAGHACYWRAKLHPDTVHIADANAHGTRQVRHPRLRHRLPRRLRLRLHLQRRLQLHLHQQEAQAAHRTTHSHRAQERSCREPPTLETTAMIAPQSFHFRSR